AEEAPRRHVGKPSRMRANVAPCRGGFRANVCNLALRLIEIEFMLIQHGVNGLVETPRCARAIAHPEFKPDSGPQWNEGVKTHRIANRPCDEDGEESKRA